VSATPWTAGEWYRGQVLVDRYGRLRAMRWGLDHVCRCSRRGVGGGRNPTPCLNRDHAFADELNGIRHEQSEKANGTKTSSPPESLVQFLLSSWASPTSFRRSAYQRSRPPRAGWRFERGARKLSGGVFMAPEQRMPQRRPRRRTSTGLARRLRSRGRRRPPATASARASRMAGGCPKATERESRD